MPPHTEQVSGGFIMCIKNYKVKNCSQCGQTFKPTGSYQKFCLNCKNESRKISHRKWRKENPKKTQAQRKRYYIKYKNNPRNPRYYFAQYQHSAKKRNIFWELTFEQFMIFWQKPCFYCKANIISIGIDRVDNDKGYEIDNLVPCCYLCNRMKMDLPQIDFIVRCIKIATL